MSTKHHAFDVDSDAIRYAMRHAGYHSARQLAEDSLVSEATINRMLYNERFGVMASTMCQIAVTLGCDVLDLMRENE